MNDKGKVLPFSPSQVSQIKQPSTGERLKAAIAERRLVEFVLNGLPRVAEPHVYGIHKGERQLLFYQIAGESKSGGLPYWRRSAVSTFSQLRVIERSFKGSREKHYGAWDEIIATVKSPDL